MRESDWQIRWNPLGASPEVLLDFGDLMDSEIARQLAASVAVGRFDFASSATVTNRKNLKRALEFSRYIDHDTNGEAVEECSARTLAGPWSKGIISLRHQEGGERLMRAALMSGDHDPDYSGPGPRSLHAYRFRVTPLALVPLGDPVTIIGGWYNPPGSGGPGTPPGIVIVVPPGGGFVPGGSIVIPPGIPGVIPGTYPIRDVIPGGSGGEDNVIVDVDHDQETRPGPPSFDFESAFVTSPDPMVGHRARVYGVVRISSSVPITLWHRPPLGGPLEWIDYGAGTILVRSDKFSDTGSSNGQWTNLTAEAPSADVVFPGAMATLRWKRTGGGAESSFGVSMEAEGTVTRNINVGGVSEFDLPEVQLSISASSHTNTAPGTFTGGGIAQAVETP